MRPFRVIASTAALALAGFAPAAPAGPGAEAEIRSCAAVAGVGSCQFSCVANGIVRVQVYGGTRSQGSATCRTDRAHCAVSAASCTDSAWLGSPEGRGWCDLTEGLVAYCSSS